MAHLQDLLVGLEPVLLLLALVAFIKSGSARRYAALATYFGIRLVSLGIQQLVFRLGGGAAMHCGTPWYVAYFYTYWASYIVCAVAVFFVLQETFRKAMEPVPGLRRLGLIAFRWVALVSLIIALGTVALPALAAGAHSSSVSRLADAVGVIGIQMVRCVSLLELCMLAFLALTIHTLGRTFRSRLFGISMGFGIDAATYLVVSALVGTHPTLASSANLMGQIGITVVLLTWTVYFAIPEPEAERNLIVLPPTSVLARWNGLAGGIGQAPALAPATAPTGFFLQDIEGVVDRVLARNPVAVGSR